MARTRHLILRENVKPRSIQLITFTNKVKRSPLLPDTLFLSIFLTPTPSDPNSL